MPLKLVVGRANAGKTGWILKWAFESLEQGTPPTLVVPNLADVRRLQRELSAKAPLGVRVLTPHTLAEELWQLHGDGRRLIGGAARSAIVRKILAEPVPEELLPSARAPGFEQLMIRTVRRSSPTVTRARSTGPADALVLDLLRRYGDALSDLGLVEEEWIGSLLADAPPETGFLAFLHFTTFSSSQVAHIRSLAEANTVCAAVTWEEGYAPTAANGHAVAALAERATEIQVATERPAGSELDGLSARLYAGAGSLRPTGQLVLGEARGKEAEVVLAAGLAGRAVRSGIAPDRVAVVFGEVGPRLHALRNAMAAEGLEADFDCPLSVGATSFGRALIALLTVATGRGARAAGPTVPAGTLQRCRRGGCGAPGRRMEGAAPDRRQRPRSGGIDRARRHGRIRGLAVPRRRPRSAGRGERPEMAGIGRFSHRHGRCDGLT